MKTLTKKEIEQRITQSLSNVVTDLKIEESKKTLKHIERISKSLSVELKHQIKKQLKKSEKETKK